MRKFNYDEQSVINAQTHQDQFEICYAFDAQQVQNKSNQQFTNDMAPPNNQRTQFIQQPQTQIGSNNKLGVHYSPRIGTQVFSKPQVMMSFPRNTHIQDTKLHQTPSVNFKMAGNSNTHSCHYIQGDSQQFYNQPTPVSVPDSMSFYRRFKKINQSSTGSSAIQNPNDVDRTQKRNNLGLQHQMVMNTQSQPRKTFSQQSVGNPPQNFIVQDQHLQRISHLNPSHNLTRISQQPVSNKDYDTNQQFISRQFLATQQPSSQVQEQVLFSNNFVNKDCASSDSSMSNGNSNNQTGITNQVDGILSNHQQQPNHSKLSMVSEILPEGIFRNHANIIYEYNPQIQAYQKKLVSVAHNFSNEYCNPNQSNYSSCSPSGHNSIFSQQPLFVKEKSNSLLLGAPDENYQMQLKNQLPFQNFYHQPIYSNEEVSTPLNRGSHSVQVWSGDINGGDHSAKSCSANKQVRFTNVAPNAHDAETTDYHAQSQLAESKDVFKEQKRTISGSSKNKRSKSPLGKKAVKQPSPLNSRNNRVQTNVSKRSKSNKSQLSQKSSLSTLSNVQKSQRKSKSKHSRSVSQQQVDEYNKLSHVQNKRAQRLGREEEHSAISKRNASAKKRKAQSKSPKINVATRNKKFQTIFIEADGLSNNQIRQIDRVSRILKNEKANKSPVRRRSVSNKRKDFSAKRRSIGPKIGTLQTYDDQYNSINSRETKSKNSNKNQNVPYNTNGGGAVELDKPLYAPQAQSQAQQWQHQRELRAQEPPRQQIQLPSQTIEPVKMMQNQSQEHPQIVVYQNGQVPHNEMLVRPIEANLVSPKQFMTMHEYASPKYTLDSSVNNEIQLTNQINQYLHQQKQMNRPESGQGVPAMPSQCLDKDEYLATWQPQTVQRQGLHQINYQQEPPYIGSESQHTMHANTSNGNTIQQQLQNTQNTLQPCWNPTNVTTHTHQTISPQNIADLQHQAKAVQQQEARANEEDQMQTFHNVYGDCNVDNSMIDQLSQMKDQRHKGQKSYNNDDINDVVPEANKEQMDTNRSSVTNTNTATTHLTNAPAPQTVHYRSKQTVGTDINLFSQKRVSSHAQGGELSSNISANDKSVVTATNMASCLTSTRWKENHDNQPIDSTREPARPNAQNYEEQEKQCIQRQINNQPSSQNEGQHEARHAPRQHHQQTQIRDQGENWADKPTYVTDGRNALGQIAPLQNMISFHQQEHFQNADIRYNPNSMYCSDFPSNGDLGSLIDRDLNNMAPQIPASRNERQMCDPQRHCQAKLQSQEALKGKSSHNTKFISFNDSQQLARNHQTIEQQNMMLMQQQMHQHTAGDHCQSLPSYQQQQATPATCRSGQHHSHVIQQPVKQMADCYYSQPLSFSQTQQAGLNHHQMNYQPNQMHLATQQQYRYGVSMVETPWGGTQALTPITHPSATISPMTSNYNLEQIPTLQNQAMVIRELEGTDNQRTDKRPQNVKKEQAKTSSKGHRSRKSQPEAVIAVKLVKKAHKRADRSPSKVSMKSTKSKKSSKSQICKRQILEISMNTLRSKQPKIKKLKSSRSLSNVSKKSKTQSVTKPKHKLSQTKTMQDFVDQQVGKQQMFPSLMAHTGQTGYVWPYNMTSPSVGSPYPVIFVKELSQPGTQREPINARKEQQAFMPLNVGCQFESLDGVGVNQHLHNNENSLEKQVSPNGPSGLTFAGFQGQRTSNPALTNLTQIQNNQSMDQQDLELDQCELEAFNIANDRDPKTMSKQKSQACYSDNLVNQTPEQEQNYDQNQVNWYIREQTDDQERLAAEGEETNQILKQHTEEQFDKEVQNNPINSIQQYAHYQFEDEDQQRVDSVRLLYDPVSNTMYNQYIDGSLVQVDQKIHVLQETNPYSKENREPPQPAASLNSLQSAQFCGAPGAGQATSAEENQQEMVEFIASQDQIGSNDNYRRNDNHRLQTEQNLKYQPIYQDQEIQGKHQRMMKSQPVTHDLDNAQNQHNQRQAWHVLKQSASNMPQPILCSQHYISIQDDQTRNDLVASQTQQSQPQGQKRRRNAKSATPIRSKKKALTLSKKRKSADVSSLKLTNTLEPARGHGDVSNKSPICIKTSVKKEAGWASKSASKPKNYRMSIDRIVQRPFNKVSQKARSFSYVNDRAIPSYRGRSKKSPMASRSVGLLPRKRLITPAQRLRNVTPNCRVLSNDKKSNSLFSGNHSPFTFRHQQNLIKRLHSDGRRSASPMALSQLQNSGMKATQYPGTTSRRPQKRSLTVQNLCGNSRCRSQLSAYKETVKNTEQAKYLRELGISKKTNHQQMQSLNNQCKRRLEFYKNSMNLEKAKTKNFVDTIKEMHAKIDNVRDKNHALYSKMKKSVKHQKEKIHHRSKSEKRNSINKVGLRELQTSDAYSRYIIMGGDCLKSNDKMLQSYGSQNHSTLSNGKNAPNILTSSQGADYKSKSSNSKISRISKDKTRRTCKDKVVNNKEKYNRDQDAQNIMTNILRGQKSDMINQLSTFEGNPDSMSKTEYGEELNVPKLINVQNSKILEPQQSSFNYVIRRNNNLSSIEDISQGAQRLKPQNTVVLSSRQIAASHRASNFPGNALSGRVPPDSCRTILTQTSTTSSEIPSLSFLSQCNKLKNNNQEIKRIENILYKNDKHVSKKKGQNLLASNRESMQAFKSKANAISNKWHPSGVSLMEDGLKSKRSTATASNPKIVRSLIDEISMRKVYKIDRIDKK